MEGGIRPGAIELVFELVDRRYQGLRYESSAIVAEASSRIWANGHLGSLLARTAGTRRPFVVTVPKPYFAQQDPPQHLPDLQQAQLAQQSVMLHSLQMQLHVQHAQQAQHCLGV